MAERPDLTSSSWQGQEAVTGDERSADKIRQDIAARRESISDAVDRLSDRFQRTLDWRAYVSDHPLAAVGAAAGLGFLVARIFRPRPSAGRRVKDALAYGVEELVDRFQHHLKDVVPHRSSAGLGAMVKATVTGLVTKAATDYLRNRFIDQYAARVERREEWGL